MSTPQRATGFTLIEMIVVIALIAVLAAVVAPNLLGKASEAKSKQPTDLALDSSGVLYIIDYYNNRIRMYTP